MLLPEAQPTLRFCGVPQETLHLPQSRRLPPPSLQRDTHLAPRGSSPSGEWLPKLTCSWAPHPSALPPGCHHCARACLSSPSSSLFPEVPLLLPAPTSELTWTVQSANPEDCRARSWEQCWLREDRADSTLQSAHLRWLLSPAAFRAGAEQVARGEGAGTWPHLWAPSF